ncbi:hypothetical protein PoB_005176700, partial [Plakobranchus ocellatus]
MESSEGEHPKARSTSGSIKMKRQSSHKSSTKNKKKELKKDSLQEAPDHQKQ